MTQLIIGYGEVGQGLHKILNCDVYDLNYQKMSFGRYAVVHICFPYGKKFIKIVKDYQKRLQPKLTIIHSTVPIGTSRKLKAVHSPIRGAHPNLEQGIRTFIKYFGGAQAKQAAALFKKFKIKTRCFPDAETTEAIKLWDTTQYGWQIILAKEIKNWCDQNNLNFEEIYREANHDYNNGYLQLNRPEVVRPYLINKAGPIGGHCVVPNSYLINSPIARHIIKYNKKLLKK